MSYIYAMFPDNRIRELRKQAKITQAQLGEMVGLHQTQIGYIENGTRSLTFEWARRIAAALGVAMVDILSADDNPWRLEDGERTLVEKYREADDKQRAIIERVAEPIPGFKHQDDKAA